MTVGREIYISNMLPMSLKCFAPITAAATTAL